MCEGTGGEVPADAHANAQLMEMAVEALEREGIEDDEEAARMSLLQDVAEAVLRYPPPPPPLEVQELEHCRRAREDELRQLDAAREARLTRDAQATADAETAFLQEQEASGAAAQAALRAQQGLDAQMSVAAGEILKLIDHYDAKQRALEEWIEQSTRDLHVEEGDGRGAVAGALREALAEVAAAEQAALPAAREAEVEGNERRRQEGLREMRRGLRSAYRRKKEAEAEEADTIGALVAPVENGERAQRASMKDAEAEARREAMQMMGCHGEILRTIDAEDPARCAVRAAIASADARRSEVELDEAACRGVWERLDDVADARRRILIAAEELKAVAYESLPLPHTPLAMTPCGCATDA